MEHCWPDIDGIVKRVRVVKEEYEGKIDGVYVMTNGKYPWLGELKDALMKGGRIKRATSSRDIELHSGAEKLAGQAVDMEIAARAGLFIGNGVSFFFLSLKRWVVYFTFFSRLVLVYDC